jgi:hypothetical protein
MGTRISGDDVRKAVRDTNRKKWRKRIVELEESQGRRVVSIRYDEMGLPVRIETEPAT